VYVGGTATAEHNLLVRIDHLIGLRLYSRWFLGTKIELTRHGVLASIVGFSLVEDLIGQHIAGGDDVLLARNIGVSCL